MPENVCDAALRISDLRRCSAEKVLRSLAEVNMPAQSRVALLERLKANGVI